MSTEKKFDPKKPVRTREGRPARIICTDCQGSRSIIALITDPEDKTELHVPYFNNGRQYSQSNGSWDLVNIPETRVGYLVESLDSKGNMFEVGIFRSQTQAMRIAEARLGGTYHRIEIEV